jgi:hypothetical protein
VLQRLADQTGHRDDDTAKPTSRSWRYLIVPPCGLALAAIDVREFARFVLSGVSATVGNMVAVWLTRRFLSFEIALVLRAVIGSIGKKPVAAITRQHRCSRPTTTPPGSAASTATP